MVGKTPEGLSGVDKGRLEETRDVGYSLTRVGGKVVGWLVVWVRKRMV